MDRDGRIRSWLGARTTPESHRGGILKTCLIAAERSGHLAYFPLARLVERVYTNHARDDERSRHDWNVCRDDVRHLINELDTRHTPLRTTPLLRVTEHNVLPATEQWVLYVDPRSPMFSDIRTLAHILAERKSSGKYVYRNAWAIELYVVLQLWMGEYEGISRARLRARMKALVADPWVRRGALAMKSKLTQTNKKVVLRDAFRKSAYQILGRIEEALRESNKLKTMNQIHHLPASRGPLFGRQAELQFLDSVWRDQRANIVVIRSIAGAGKTALVSEWLAQGVWHRDAEACIVWSFHSQGVTEHRQESSDPFIEHSLLQEGDIKPSAGTAWARGERLGRILSQKKTLLVLDGIEPLQERLGDTSSRIKDPALLSLLRVLENVNRGLCIITTRLPVQEFESRSNNAIVSLPLERIARDDGAKLLRSFGVLGGPTELANAVDECKGHAFAVSLLGSYLNAVHRGDVRKRDRIPGLLSERTWGSKVRNLIASYEKWLSSRPELRILRIASLFDRPADGEAIREFIKTPPIPGLSDGLKEMSYTDWQYALNTLRGARLVYEEVPGDSMAVECHPLVREYFAQSLRKDFADSWRAGHTVLFEYFKRVQKRGRPTNIRDLDASYRATIHGCLADLHQEALDQVFRPRVLRGSSYFSFRELGAYSSDLTCLHAFFEQPWDRPVAGLGEGDRAELLNLAASCLRALGRMAEGIESMRAALDLRSGQKDWESASRNAFNLGEMFLASGNLHEALEYAKAGIKHADRSPSRLMRLSTRTLMGHILCQRGDLTAAALHFRQAAALQRRVNPKRTILWGFQGYRYNSFLLLRGDYRRVQSRITRTIKISRVDHGLMEIALDHLACSAALVLRGRTTRTGRFKSALSEADAAVDGLRAAGRHDYLPYALLARSGVHALRADLERAFEDLGEAAELIGWSESKLLESDWYVATLRVMIRAVDLECPEQIPILVQTQKRIPFVLQGDATNMIRQCAEQASTSIEKLGYTKREAEILALRSRVYLFEGDRRRARHLLTLAERQARKRGLSSLDPDLDDARLALRR